jgi:hypothetical protein
VHHSFQNWLKDLNIDQQKQHLKLLKFILKIYLNAFALNTFLTLKIMNFENMLTKVLYFYFIQSMGE